MGGSIKILKVEDKEDKPSYDQSQHVEKSMVCSEKSGFKERGKSSQINFSSCCSNSEISLLRREIPMAWGTTIDSFDSRNQSFPICNRNKMSNTKGSDLVPYSRRLK